jgi:hypothetical protein
MCADAAAEERYAYRRSDTHRKIEMPQAWNAVKPGTCWHCGLVGPHPTRDDCITALRDLLAKL